MKLVNTNDKIIYTDEEIELDISINSETVWLNRNQISRSYHDRFIIIDNIEVYHIGASLKDLGKKVFAFSKMDRDLLKI